MLTEMSATFRKSSEFRVKILNRLYSKGLWSRFSRLCEEVGLERSILILSFDCDTDDDRRVVAEVHKKILDLGINPVYAVPGAVLERGEKEYGFIALNGGEFINHGGRDHTYFDVSRQRYASCFFYHQQDFAELEQDILDGHKKLKNILGIEAKGWRTPHFGTFSSERDLKFIHRILADLGYLYSTSSSPQLAFEKGPVILTKYNLFEIPVSGTYSRPLSIFDSWGFFAAPERIHSPQQYLHECGQLATFAKDNIVLINIYADPSHVFDHQEFFDGLAALRNFAVSLNYSQLLKELK